eukprot:838789-Pelagomonas_calceolata.AAC.5
MIIHLGLKKKKNNTGSEDTPRINEGKEDTLGRGTVYPLHQGKQERSRWGSGELLAVARA